MKHKTREDQRGEKTRGEKRREETRSEKKQDMRRDKMKREREVKKVVFFFKKNVSRPSNAPDELAQNVSKKIPFGRIIPPFFLRKCRIWPCFQLFT